ncbi:MAG: hypothetical protein HYV45_03770 [Candidatus Moranbacteria bacterium]|nr:hypothetical protein [Candidatus Moranbacteria bacterium]
MEKKTVVIPVVPFIPGMEGRFTPYEALEDKDLLRNLLGEESQRNSLGPAGEGGCRD